MRSRWFHIPVLHSPTPGHEKKVEWLELFYDLIYVAALIQLGNALSHHVSVLGFLSFAALFVPLWLAWTSFTFYSNRFDIDDLTHRVLVFANMFGVGAMAISVPGVLEGETQAFALSYAATRCTLLLMTARAHKHVPEARDLTGRTLRNFGLDAACWVAAAFAPAPWNYVLMALGIGSMLALPISRNYRELTGRHPPDVLHMSERYGLLTIIVLGEGFVKSLTELADKGATSETLLMGAMTLLITCSIWWVYFDDIAGSKIKSKRSGAAFVWVYMHLPMMIAVTAVGVAAKKAIYFDVGEVAPPKYRWLLCGALALVFLSVGVIDAVTERRESELSDRGRVNMRLISAAAVLLLAAAGGFLPGAWFLGLVTTFCVVQVLFDLMMAPMVDPHAHHEGAQDVFAKYAPAAPLGTEPTVEGRRRRRSPDEAVRKGTPNELRRDLYFYFMEGSWRRLFVAFAVTYLLVNVLFACLYLLDPSSVSGLKQGSFLDAFAFSVQTMSTIGYGVMAPLTDYAHMLVTIQAGTALLGVALATGLMFAKASRPRSSVLFSTPILVTLQDGKPVVKFRVGNARGNEVVEAQMTLTLLKDEVTAEGATFRRLHDVKLRRASSPLFTISWTVIHEIDEDSPFYDVDWDDPGATMLMLIATMLGHDATYGSTTHARHFYYADDFLNGARFVDVIETLEDGRLQVDYTRFHDVLPDPEHAVTGHLGPAKAEVLISSQPAAPAPEDA